jgi:putative ABC transport system permease protein
MLDLDKWQEIFGTIRKHKLRTLLTAFGVFWGIFMLVLLLGAGRGLENGVFSMFGSLAKNAMWIWGGKTTAPYKGIKPGRWVVYSNDDYYALKKEFPEIQYINPGISLTGNFSVGYKNNTGAFKVGGDSPALNDIRPMNYTAGRFLNQKDMDEKRKVAVIGARVVEVLFDKENPIGKYIKIKGVYFLVIGTFIVENPGGSGRDDAEKIFIPITTLQQTFNAPNKVHGFGISPKDGVDPEELEQRVKQFLAARHDVAPEDKSAIGSWNSGKETKKFTGLFAGINTFIWGVSIMTIIAGIVGISNIMLIIVKERTKEIGIRKALGASPGSIVSLILTESIFITSIAGYLGLSAGVGAIGLIRHIMETSGEQNPYFSNPHVDFRTAVLATCILIISGALAGLFPAMKAAHINPIEALRAE